MKLGAKLDDLIAENLYPVTLAANDYDGAGSKHGRLGAFSTKNGLTIVDKHIDVHEDEGYITIPCKEIPDCWNEESDMLSFRSLDRPFVFPGEQVHILACLSTSKLDEYRGKSDELLIRFKNSHFFARIAEADESLWSRRKIEEKRRGSTARGKFIPIESRNDDVAVDRGILDASTSGGVAKNDVKCCQLANGDIVVILQVNIDVDFFRDPVLEVLQFEKHVSENSDYSKHDPFGDLLKWLLPVQNSITTPRFYSPQEMSPSSSARSSLTKPHSPSSFGSQNFLLGQFRSHSMSSLYSKSQPRSTLLTSGNEKSGGGVLSFRGVQQEPERFSVRCGLEGIYVPGRKWRRKIEIIQPLEICCFSTDCNTEDLICVQIKNISPAHSPDIVIYLDAITFILEEASKGGPPLSLPIVCIQAGDGHGLPNLPLRRGEEHSFILKPATPIWSCDDVQGEKIARSSVQIFSIADRGSSNVNNNKYAVVVSCRCNYTESKLLFKQPTNWRPHIQKEILISIASHMSRKTLGPNERSLKLPIQVLTLQASNLSNEDLSLTWLAPSTIISSSLACSPKQCDHTSIFDVHPGSDLGRTHMWLKSRVPLGCVPSRSTVNVKLELLPLTDGIVTLDSLQINVEKGLSYVPEHPLKIKSTCSIRIGAI